MGFHHFKKLNSLTRSNSNTLKLKKKLNWNFRMTPIIEEFMNPKNNNNENFKKIYECKYINK